MQGKQVTIIGAGIIGLAAAYKLQLAHPDIAVTVLEKEPEVGRHQSGNNSGVLHAGLYYKPGSLKARLAVSGIRQMTVFCRETGVPHEVCGKLVIATAEHELPRLRDLLSRGQQNGLQGLEWLNAEQIREIEPHASGIAAIRVPEEGIVHYGKVCGALVRKLTELGSRVVTSARVRAVSRRGARWVTQTDSAEYHSDLLINCAGLYADRIAALCGVRVEVQIIPFRGEYYSLKQPSASLVRHLIYPVPDAKFPFLGVHFTRSVLGGIEAGPNAVLALARQGYKRTTVNVRDVIESLSFPGLWRFTRNHPAMCWSELRQSFSRELFCRALQRLVPEINRRDLVPGGAGVRAQAMFRNGQLVNDFLFASRPGALHILNAPSPGATASLAIGDEIVRLVGSSTLAIV
jgi:L-2-hydroxyglutarate oxidase